MKTTSSYSTTLIAPESKPINYLIVGVAYINGGLFPIGVKESANNIGDKSFLSLCTFTRFSNKASEKWNIESILSRYNKFPKGTVYGKAVHDSKTNQTTLLDIWSKGNVLGEKDSKD